jgi:peptide/nickel transport system substrate-binding protein
MSADDVVAIDRLADPKNASNALSAFSGVLSKGGTKKVDDDTVEFHLDAPNGNFPYYVSSDNYNTIILPADYAGDFEKNFIGTGPFKLEKYTPKVGASFLRNPDYWGPKALPERPSSATPISGPDRGLRGGWWMSSPRSRCCRAGAANDRKVSIISLRSSAHTQCICAPTWRPTDKRCADVGSAWIAKLVKGLFRGRSTSATTAPSRLSIPRPIPRCHSVTWTSARPSN